MPLILILSAALYGAHQTAGSEGQAADLIVRAARIYTVDPARPVARIMAVREGRILAVGDDAEAYARAGTRVIELPGATIVPGFIDCHVHMEGLGELLETHDFRHARTPGEIIATLRREAVRRPRGEWIVGRNWDQTNWGGTFPDAEELSRAIPEHPVYLTRVDGHAAWVNRKALELAGIGAQTPDPPGGKILRRPDGSPTGILIDRAQELVASKIPAPSPQILRRRLARAARESARQGLTTVHDAGVSAAVMAAYRELVARDELPIRVYAMIGGEGELWRQYLERGPEVGDRLTVRSIKLMADGAMGSRGAAFFEPYSDDPGNTGLLLLQREDIERVARQAVARGFQVNTHAIGDRANRLVLEAYASVLGGPNDRRFRIEHAQVVAPEDFEKFARYSIIASMQPTHATSDMRWAEARVGPERVKGAYAWRRFLALGVPVASGSDFPVEEPNPLWGFYAAITRQDHSGNPPGGWFPEQRMTRQEALESWTIRGAYAAFEENIKGSLSPGKLADFVALSADIMQVPPAEILKTRVLLTAVGGRVVYQGNK
ncbi:MAG: amidohydrolase [Bryobacterales bacterium]|nr:amidohydrolase [Bryobacterales bacterium]